MFSESLLVFHIAGAVLTALAGVSALGVVYRSQNAWYRISAVGLGALAAFEICTGALLSLISPTVLALYVCERVTIYLALVLLVESLLFERMRENPRGFPTIQVATPILTSLGLLGAVLALGF